MRFTGQRETHVRMCFRHIATCRNFVAVASCRNVLQQLAVDVESYPIVAVCRHVSKMSQPPPPVKKVTASKVSPLAEIKALESDPSLQALIEQYLPPNYDFEIAKTVWRIRKTPNCTTVALQMPEGLLIFATKIAQVLATFCSVDTLLMGDVTYGACCVDDFTASMLGAQLLVHYGHSCLVPTSVANRIDTIYVFVTIKFDLEACVGSLKGLLTQQQGVLGSQKKIQLEEEPSAPLSVALVSTIQFANSLQQIKEALEQEDNEGDPARPSRKLLITIPRSKPLSAGEILGCTAPKVDNCDVIIYIGDGRFHLEAMMMANRDVPAYRYDPYNRTLTHEEFDHTALASSRQAALLPLLSSRRPLRIGVIQGTLGRQGNPKPVDHVFQRLKEKGHSPFIILMSEVLPAKLKLFSTNVDLWVQFACPRLSIDWGEAFKTPIITPFEAMWAVSEVSEASSSRISENCSGSGGDCPPSCRKYEGHPMDYYAYESGGPHTPNFMPTVPKTRTTVRK